MPITAFMNAESFKNIDQPVGLRYLVRPLSQPIAWLLNRIGIGPNTVTLFRGIGTVVIFLFILLKPEEMPAALAAFLLVSVVGTAVDGCLSRLQNSSSYFGKYFDGYIDSMSEVALYSVLGFGFWLYEANNTLLVLGILSSLSLSFFQAGGIRHEMIRQLMVSEGHAPPDLNLPSVINKFWVFIGRKCPIYIWDFRYIGMMIGLIFGHLSLYFTLICYVQILFFVVYVPLRIFVSSREIGVPKISASSLSKIENS